MTDDEQGDWREAAKKVMFQATEEEALRRYGTAKPAYNYRWEHVRAVVNVAMRLAKLVGADLEVTEAAAWLHDVAKDKGSNHPQAGAEFAREFLRQTNFPDEKIEGVAQVIAGHMGLWRDEPLDHLESMVLWDADKLTKIGLTAAFHWTGMILANGKPVSTNELISKARDADWQQKTVESMHTGPARRAARARFHAFNQLWDSLEAELNGDDLESDSRAVV